MLMLNSERRYQMALRDELVEQRTQRQQRPGWQRVRHFLWNHCFICGPDVYLPLIWYVFLLYPFNRVYRG